MNARIVLLTLGLLYVSIQSIQAQCIKQLERSAACYQQIDNVRQKGRANIERGQDQEKSTYRKVAEECLKSEGCQMSDPLDQKDIAKQICLNKIQRTVYTKIDRCIQRSGEARFTLPKSLRRPRRGPRKFKQKARVSVKDASRKCEKDLKKKTLSIKINRCIRKNMPKSNPSARRQPKDNLLGLAGKFQKFCGKRKQCQQELNQRCNSKICRCVEETRRDQQVKSELDACMRQQMRRSREPYKGDADAGLAVDKITRKGLRFCQQKGSQDICRTDSNPLLKLFNLKGANPLTSLTGGGNPLTSLTGGGSLGSLGKLLGGK